MLTWRKEVKFLVVGVDKIGHTILSASPTVELDVQDKVSLLLLSALLVWEGEQEDNYLVVQEVERELHELTLSQSGIRTLLFSSSLFSCSTLYTIYSYAACQRSSRFCPRKPERIEGTGFGQCAGCVAFLSLSCHT
jgi:hypothetical protein